MPVLASTDINAFHVIGALLAIWAVLLAVLGITRHDFPGKQGAERIVIAISALLVAGSIGSAIASSGEEKPKGEEIRNVENKGGKEGSSEPEQGGTQAPETGSEQGQEEGKENAPTPGGQPTGQTLTLNADPSGRPAFDKTSLQSKPGTVRIVMQNPAPVPHNVSLEGAGIDEEGPTVQKGGSSQVTAKVKPGQYTYYCSVPGHRESGMEGTLTVK